jgi:general secretion pathway protein G
MNRKLLHAPARAAAAGFTLVEIMVVIVILGLLATMVVTNVVGASDDAKIKIAQTDVKTIAGAVKMYRITHSKLPENLEVLTEKNEKGGGNWLEELKRDPWDHDYELREGNNQNDWEVVSLGPDGIQSEDDISSKAKDK